MAREDVTVHRELFVPRELVFDAWTQAQHLAAWYPPQGGRLDDAHIEPRPGGRYDVGWRDADETAHTERGTLRALDRRDGFRWVMCAEDGGGPAATEDMEVHVRLSGDGGTCTITVHHDGLPSVEWRDRYQALWEARLDRLAGYFSAI
jgi:uncharacterized protein YndB with AHSA1/START domain